MSPKDLLLALVVVLAWGVNFVVIKVGLHGVPPIGSALPPLCLKSCGSSRAADSPRNSA